MDSKQLKKISDELIDTFLTAGERSIKLRDAGLKKEIKHDNTPVTNGDIEVNNILTNKIKNITPQIPIVSEESSSNKSNKCNLIDIRDQVELEKQGRIENAFHISRGLLEFSIHPDSAYVQNNKLDLNKELILFCAAGGRSALAAKTLNEMGFKNVSHVDGGFELMKQNGFKLKT